jgi:hypothetical protein
MPKNGKTAKAEKSARKNNIPTSTDKRPTVTGSGQIIWSTRDLLFPSGYVIRSASKVAKK